MCLTGWFTDFWKEILQKVQESKSPYGVFHACELETSLMLHIAPQMVDMEQAKDETPDRQFEGDRFISLYGPVTMGWKTSDVSHSGVIGRSGGGQCGERTGTYGFCCSKADGYYRRDFTISLLSHC